MALVETAIGTVHLLFAAAWVGGVLFLTLGVLPLAREADIEAAPVVSMTGTLLWISRASAVVLLLTGGHMAASLYTVETLTGSTRGHLVLGMVALWFLLTALVEFAGNRMRADLQEGYLRDPARSYTNWFRLASLVGIALLIDAGAISGVA